MTTILIIAVIVAYLLIGYAIGYAWIANDDDTADEYLHDGVRHMFVFSLFAWPIVLMLGGARMISVSLQLMAQGIIDRKEAGKK